MVSLDRERWSPGAGVASFFPEESSEETVTAEDDALLLTNVLVVNEKHITFFPVSVWIIITIQLLSIVGLLACLFVVQDINYVNISHVILWTFLLLTCYGLHRYHKVLRCYGYLEFCRNTDTLLTIPVLIASFGNGMLLICISILQLFCSNSKFCPRDSKMEGKYYLWIICLMEASLLFPFCIAYIWLVIKFIRNCIPPDVQQDELFASCVQSRMPTGEIGFKGEDFREEILEKQADMIRYLKQRNEHLCRKILKLTTEAESSRQSSYA